MKLFSTHDGLSYEQAGHPESPDRLRNILTCLVEKGLTFTVPKPCDEVDVLNVHTPELVDEVKTGVFFDPDTPAYPGIFDIALLSAGSAIEASQSALSGENSFSLMRPPGHHATRARLMGFCYFNNIAVATARYLKHHPEGKVAILDIDCHHGNGTEDIFLGNESVLVVSLHQVPLYPGSGLHSVQNCLNYPVSPGTESAAYLRILEDALGKIDAFDPDLVGVSAGFDTCRGDPLSNLLLDIPTYRQIGQMINELNRPAFHTLEGGYSTDLHRCVYEYILGLSQTG